MGMESVMSLSLHVILSETSMVKPRVIEHISMVEKVSLQVIPNLC